MTGRHLVAAAAVLGALAVLAFFLRGGGEARAPALPAATEGAGNAENPPPSFEANISAAERPAEPGEPPPLKRPEAPKPGIPLLSDGRVARVRLGVERSPQSDIVVRVDGEKSGARVKHWEDLLRVAAFAALDGLPDAPGGLLISLRPNEARPQAGQLAALSLAIRLALAGVPYPSDLLLEGLVAPDGTIQPVANAGQTARRAAGFHMRLAAGPTLERLAIGLKAASRPERRPPAQVGVPPPDLRAPHLDLSRAALRQVIGTVMRRKPVRLPLPADWRERGANIEARIARSRPANLAELVAQGVAARELRAAFRAVRFATQRISAYAKRLVRDKTPIGAAGSAPLQWLTLLVTMQVEGVAASTDWLRALPGDRERPRMLTPPNKWLVARTTALRAVTRSMTRLIRRRLRGRRTTPLRWPLSTPAILAWPGTGPALTRAPAADWGDHLIQTATVWARLALIQTLAPTRDAQVADPGAVRVSDRPRLDAMARLAQARALTDMGRLDRVPGEIERLIGAARSRANTGHRVAALESWWTAGLLARETERLGRVITPHRGAR